MSDDLAAEVDRLRTLLHTQIERRKALEARVDDLEATNDELRDRVATLEAFIETDVETMAFEEMSKDQKVLRVQRTLARKAARRSGKAKIDYNDVLDVFNGKPSPPHAYDLMRQAGSADGFAFKTPSEGNYHLRCSADRISNPAIVSALKTPRPETAD